MDKQQAQQILIQVTEEYDSIEDPKYRNANLEDMKFRYQRLMDIRDHMKGDRTYSNLVNAISQIIKKLDRKSSWRNTSERGINKAIPPVVKRRNIKIEFPFGWYDEKSGHQCLINNGYWGAKNYMLMDALGYFFLLKEGGDRLPDDPSQVFNDMESIRRRESELCQSPKTSDLAKGHILATENDANSIKGSDHWVRFDDRYFRKFTGSQLSSNEILKLVHDTSQVEFKLAFPVRLMENKKNPKERVYIMNMFSRLFEFGYINKDVRSDGVVQCREYFVGFDTTLGMLFVHNLKSRNYDWLDNSFYNLPHSAQIFYRRFLIHNDYTQIPVNIETVAQKLNLYDKNLSNLTGTIEANALEPLKRDGLISSYKREDGLSGIKYIIARPPRSKNSSLKS